MEGDKVVVPRVLLLLLLMLLLSLLLLLLLPVVVFVSLALFFFVSIDTLKLAIFVDRLVHSSMTICFYGVFFFSRLPQPNRTQLE